MVSNVPSTRKGTNFDLSKDSSTTAAPIAAVLLIAQQFGSRGVTFLANQILLRYLSPELLGVSTQLELYSITVLFFARESLRVALQRQTEVTENQDPKHPIPPGHVDARSVAGRSQVIVNLAYISLFMGLVAVGGFGWLYHVGANAGDQDATGIPDFTLSLVLYGLASVLELLAEPYYLIAQQRSRLGIRAVAESVATCMRCFVTCASSIAAFRFSASRGLLPFALGQLTYSISLLVVYYRNVAEFSSRGGFSFLPMPIYSPDTEPDTFVGTYFSHTVLRLAGSFFIQSIFKHVLTRGDTILISALTTPRVQGIYALANNYGSLIARLILQPVEDVSRNYFGKLLSSSRQLSTATVRHARSSLIQLIRLYIIISLFLISIGPTAAPLLLKIVAGPRWVESGAGDVLATFCYYIPLLAINGLTEAFVSCATTESEVHRQTAWMVSFSAAFAAAALLFLKVWHFGPQGLVYANAFNMILRVIWATAFIRSYLARWQIAIGFEDLIPRLDTVAASVGGYGISRQLEKDMDGSLLDIFKVGVVACLLFIIMSITERRHLRECYDTIFKPTCRV